MTETRSALKFAAVACAISLVGRVGSGGDALPRLSAATRASLASCTQLTTAFQFANTTITSADSVPSGALTWGGRAIGAHCLVKGEMFRRTSPQDQKSYAIGFEMRLPSAWKVMVYHGVSDAIFSANDTTTWYEGLRAGNGGDASNFARFYRVPGMAHCAGGPSTDQFDMLTALVSWVERGEAPDSVLAYARGVGNAVGANPDVPSTWSHRSRPLCPYPKVARLKAGATDLESAESFSCR